MTALEVIDSRYRTTLRWNDMTSSACFNRGRIKPPGHNPDAIPVAACTSLLHRRPDHMSRTQPW